MTKALRKVEVSKPPRITFAIGLWISLPGRPPRKARGQMLINRHAANVI
jgi:hypothetical protein